MGGVPVNLHVEDVTGVLVLVVRAFNLGLVLRRAVVVHRDVAGVGIVILVRNARNDAEGLLVAFGKAARKTLCRRSQEGEVVLEGLGETVDLLCHVRDDPQAQFLSFLALPVVFSDQGDEALGQTDEANGQGPLVHDGLDGIVLLQFFAAQPEAAHEQRELLLEGGLLEIVTLVQLLGGNIQGPVQLLEEGLDAALFVFLLLHGLDGQFHDVDGGEAQVAAADGGLGTELITIYARTAAHRGHFVDIALRIVRIPGIVLVEGSVQVQEVGEEPAGAHLAGEFVQVIVAVFGQVADAAFLLPDLDGEDGGGSVAHTFISRIQDFPDDAATLGRRIGTVVDGREDHLVAAAAVDGVHVVHERLHGLVNTAHRLVHGMLKGPFATLQAHKVTPEVIIHGSGFQFGIILVHHGAHLVHFLFEGFADIGGQVEIEGGNGLAAMHLILDGFHGNASQHGGRFDALRGTGLPMAGLQPVFQNQVQRVLDAGKRLGGIIILVVDMDVVARNGFPHVTRQQTLVHIGLGGLGGELHHHARRRIGVHVRIFAGDVIGLRVDDGLENLVRPGFAGQVALIAVGDILPGHFLAGALHEFEFHQVLDILHAQLIGSLFGNGIRNLCRQDNILALLRYIHCLQDGGDNLLAVEFNEPAIAFYYILYHIKKVSAITRLPWGRTVNNIWC